MRIFVDQGFNGVVTQIRASRHLPERQDSPGVDHDYAPTAVAVVGVHAEVGPHHRLVEFVDPTVVLVVDFRPDLQGRDSGIE